MTIDKNVKLLDGKSFPRLGLGVMYIADDKTAEVVRSAVKLGYRAFDTAPVYRNETGTGAGVNSASLPRSELMVTTKLWNERQGDARAACQESLKSLGLDYIDVYLIHWPAPLQGKFVQAWKTMIELQNEGLVRSIGVSNFTIDHLERIIGETGVAPVMNQIELHPTFQQRALREYHKSKGIATESWSPLGRGASLVNPTIEKIASKHGRSPGQIILRWHVESELVVIPKAASLGHLKENLQIFDFALDAEDLEAIGALDDPNGRMGPDPNTFYTINPGQSPVPD